MLKQFRALPTESRVQNMKERDYLWCLVQMLLDREEELERLCPECRAQSAEACCPSCGRPASAWGESGSNSAFDPERFEKLKGGG